jgi:hypothetical protein
LLQFRDWYKKDILPKCFKAFPETFNSAMCDSCLGELLTLIYNINEGNFVPLPNEVLACTAIPQVYISRDEECSHPINQLFWLEY